MGMFLAWSLIKHGYRFSRNYFGTTQEHFFKNILKPYFSYSFGRNALKDDWNILYICNFNNCYTGLGGITLGLYRTTFSKNVLKPYFSYRFLRNGSKVDWDILYTCSFNNCYTESGKTTLRPHRTTFKIFYSEQVYPCKVASFFCFCFVLTLITSIIKI